MNCGCFHVELLRPAGQSMDLDPTAGRIGVDLVLEVRCSEALPNSARHDIDNLLSILKIARTIADLAGADLLAGPHVREAIQYRSLDRRKAAA